MILSNLEIQAALDGKRLVIEPEPLPRSSTIGSPEKCPYNTHSVDLRLHNEIAIPQGGAFAYDFKAKGSIAEFLSKNSKDITLTDDQPFHLKPHTFILGKTVERIYLPIRKGKPCLAARIEGKSSRARCGLLVHFTAPTVHPGFAGTLTLEMINLGAGTILLHPNMPIAQLIIEQVLGEPLENPSQFQNQSTAAGL